MRVLGVVVNFRVIAVAVLCLWGAVRALRDSR